MQPALLFWRAGSTREKMRSIVLSLLAMQRGKDALTGSKAIMGLPGVPVSRSFLECILPNDDTLKKFTHWVEDTGLVKKDHSWVSASIAKDAHCEPHCDTWHVTEPDHPGKRDVVEVEYDEDAGHFGMCKKAIRLAEGTILFGDVAFHGAWAIDEYESGELPWHMLYEVAKIARNVLKEPKVKGCRTFDSITMAKKDLRERCFMDGNGNGLCEKWDGCGFASVTGPLALGVFRDEGYKDTDLVKWAQNLEFGTPIDWYKRLYDAALKDIDPNTNAFGLHPEWTDSWRKKVKKDINCIENCNLSYVRGTREAYSGFFEDPKHPKPSHRRQFILLKAVKKHYPQLWDAIVRTKESGVKDAYYRLHTMGEKMLIGFVMEKLDKLGFIVFRVHDALWSCDPRLNKEWLNRLIGNAIANFLSEQRNVHGRDGIRELARKYLTPEEMSWVKEGLARNNK